MPTITSSTGLATGIDSAAIIDQLMKLEERPKTRLQTRVTQTETQKKAYQALLDNITKIRNNTLSLQRPSTFNASTATSSNENVLSATTSPGAAIGSYSFRVARLVTAQQTVSTGFADFNTQKVGAGTLSVEMGGGEVDTETMLADLNGGTGVTRGLFRITDRSGATAVIDATGAVSVDDVIKKINSSLDVRIKAEVKGDKLVLTDATGSTSQNLVVQDMGEGKTAAGLGIITSSTGVASSTLTGTDINSLATTTSLSKLNDGLGVRRASGTGSNDLKITTKDGGSYEINLAAAKTVADIASEVDAATGGKVKISINATGDGLTVNDTSSGGSAFSITALNGSKAAADLGILAAAPGGSTVNGTQVLSSLNTVMLKTLNGGAGLTLGQLKITDRSGTAATIDLGAAKTMQDVLDTINNTTAGGFSVKASVKDSGNGIQITDGSGGTSDLIIEDVTLGTATSLGLNGTFTNTQPAAIGKNLQRQWVNENSLLSSLNGGKGVTAGKMKFTGSNGNVANVDISNAGYTTLGQVMGAINAKTTAIGVTVGLNANGDGLLVTDAGNGAGKLKIEDSTGTVAGNLNIRGQAATVGNATIDGSFEKTITVSATDTLKDIQTKFTDLSFGVTASVINDGSGASPFRLSLTALNSGRNGRIVFDAGATKLGTRSLVEAQDAAVFVGGSGGADPLLVTGSSNQLSGVLPGVNIELHSVSENAVSLNVVKNADDLVKTVQEYVDGFNDTIAGVNELTKFDPDTLQRGMLMGEGAMQGIENALYESLNSVVVGTGQYRILSDVGIRIVDGGVLEFDEEKFRGVYAKDAVAVEKLFTSTDKITTTKVTTGGVLTNGLSASGTPINNVVTGGATITTTTTNGPTIANGTTTDGLGTTNTVGALTTITGAVITQNSTQTIGRGFGWLLEKSLSKITDPVDGIIKRTKDTLDDRADDFRDRIESLDKVLTAKRERLQRQFANMESVISGLQSQQSALASFQPLSYSST